MTSQQAVRVTMQRYICMITDKMRTAKDTGNWAAYSTAKEYLFIALQQRRKITHIMVYV